MLNDYALFKCPNDLLGPNLNPPPSAILYYVPATQSLTECLAIKQKGDSESYNLIEKYQRERKPLTLKTWYNLTKYKRTLQKSL